MNFELKSIYKYNHKSFLKSCLQDKNPAKIDLKLIEIMNMTVHYMFTEI